MYPKNLFRFDAYKDQYSAEMSDLRLPPGQFPAIVQIEDEQKVTSFRLAGVVSDNGELRYILYRNFYGATVMLFND
jgi:hypothetical protein